MTQYEIETEIANMYPNGPITSGDRKLIDMMKENSKVDFNVNVCYALYIDGYETETVVYANNPHEAKDMFYQTLQGSCIENATFKPATIDQLLDCEYAYEVSEGSIRSCKGEYEMDF
jgi:hypothetical protein